MLGVSGTSSIPAQLTVTGHFHGLYSVGAPPPGSSNGAGFTYAFGINGASNITATSFGINNQFGIPVFGFVQVRSERDRRANHRCRDLDTRLLRCRYPVDVHGQPGDVALILHGGGPLTCGPNLTPT